MGDNTDKLVEHSSCGQCTTQNVSSKHLSSTCHFSWSLVIGRHKNWQIGCGNLRFYVLIFPIIAHSNVKLLSRQKHTIFTQMAKSRYYSQDLHITTSSQHMPAGSKYVRVTSRVRHTVRPSIGRRACHAGFVCRVYNWPILAETVAVLMQ